MNKQKNCQNCLKGKFISFNGHYLCSLKGIVTAEYWCKKHRFMDKLQINVETLKCEDCTYFITIVNTTEGSKGICRLFSERQFNGSIRKACGKVKPFLQNAQLSC